MLLRSIAWAAIILSTIAAPAGAAPRSAIRLTDQRGTTFAFSSLRGAPLVVTFVSAHCDDACPLVEAQLARTVEQLKHSPLAVRFLTVTLDPERDSTSDMRRLARAFDADGHRWIFATGPLRDVHELMQRFAIHVERDHRGYATSHASYVYVLDSELRIERTLLPSDDLSTQLSQEGLGR